MKGDQLQFVQLKEEKSEPKATAFLTHAQRKAMKKQKKIKIVPKAAEQMLKKDTKLTFNKELCQFKPFKVSLEFRLKQLFELNSDNYRYKQEVCGRAKNNIHLWTQWILLRRFWSKKINFRPSKGIKRIIFGLNRKCVGK